MSAETNLQSRNKDLEGFSSLTGKEIYMELRGDPPLVPGRNEIALRGVIVGYNYEEKTVTLKLPISRLAALSEHTLTPKQAEETVHRKESDR